MKAPFRKRLPHDIPLWVDPSKTYYFITICCRQRGKNHLAHPVVANNIFETIKHRNGEGIWYAHLALVTPDHVHLLLSFPQREKTRSNSCEQMETWTAKTLKIEWQRDFFEHRLRKEESFREKADYILANPVRAGFVDRAENWPHVFIADPW